MKKGQHCLEETKRKISKAQKGVKGNNYGKPLPAHVKQKISEKLKGHKTSEETRLKLSEQKKGNKNPQYGKPISEIAKRKMSQSRSKEKHWNWKGGKIKIICKVCGKERYAHRCHVKKRGNKFCSHRCNAIWGVIHSRKSDTKIERLVEDELIRRNIPYTKQVPLLGITVVDFLLSNNIIIYADGDYWHNLPHVKTKNINQNYMLTFYGYKVFRFWEKDIKKSAKNCIDKINL